jgi:hypothetical protein
MVRCLNNSHRERTPYLELDPELFKSHVGSGSGCGYKTRGKIGSGSNTNIFGSTTLLYENLNVIKSFSQS